jgi:hypothetical protein
MTAFAAASSSSNVVGGWTPALSRSCSFQKKANGTLSQT